MRIAFMGTPDFAVPALQKLLESKHEVCIVITQPDRPRGRGRKAEPCPVKALAETQDAIAVVQPERIRKSDVAELLRARRIDIAVVVAYGQILPKEILDAPRLGCINIHASLLPAWRGAAPIQRCILSGAETTGITIMQLDEGMDTGPIIAQQSVDILPDDDARSVADMLAVLGGDMMLRVLDDAAETGKIESTPQDDALASAAPPIKKEEGRIDWCATTEEIIILMRAMTPWPGAFTELTHFDRGDASSQKSGDLGDGSRKRGEENDTQRGYDGDAGGGDDAQSDASNADAAEEAEQRPDSPRSDPQEGDAQAGYRPKGNAVRLTLLQAEPLWVNETADLDKRGASTEPGAVVYLLKGYGPVVRTGSGYMLVTRVKPAGKAEMDGVAFMNGRGISVGDRVE